MTFSPSQNFHALRIPMPTRTEGLISVPLVSCGTGVVFHREQKVINLTAFSREP